MKIYLKRIPDISNARQLHATPYWAYGRFALLRGGGFWWGDLHSSHPSDTVTGWYWAIDPNGDLAVSARGVGIDGDILVNERKDVLACLVEELVRRRVIRKPQILEWV